jgi:hypothetical protein
MLAICVPKWAAVPPASDLHLAMAPETLVGGMPKASTSALLCALPTDGPAMAPTPANTSGALQPTASAMAAPEDRPTM